MKPKTITFQPYQSETYEFLTENLSIKAQTCPSGWNLVLAGYVNLDGSATNFSNKSSTARLTIWAPS